MNLAGGSTDPGELFRSITRVGQHERLINEFTNELGELASSSATGGQETSINRFPTDLGESDRFSNHVGGGNSINGFSTDLGELSGFSHHAGGRNNSSMAFPPAEIILPTDFPPI